MNVLNDKPKLSESLEDYLESIYTLVRDRKVARVKEIAKARGVSMASVSTAMHRLSEKGLIHYNQREFIELTPKGEKTARRTMARHELLVRFFKEILLVSPVNAEEDACSVEHVLSDEPVDHLVRLFEFITRCPKGRDGFLESFRPCSVIHPGLPPYEHDCVLCVSRDKAEQSDRVCKLSDLQPGEWAEILQVEARGAIRQRLIDMGMLPDTLVEVERKAPGGNPIWIRMKGFQLSLRLEEAEGVAVLL